MRSIGIRSRSRKVVVLVVAVAVLVPVAALSRRDPSPTVGAATLPAFAAGSAAVVEGDDLTRIVSLPVTLSDRATTLVSVDYAVTAGSASAGSDFTARSGTLRFKPGGSGVTPVRKNVNVTVKSDTAAEPAETFTLTLSNATGGAAIGIPTGTGTIINDDPGSGVRIGVGDAAIAEGDAGPTRPATSTVTLSRTSGATVTVKYQIAAGTASGGSDFKTKSGTITFKPGQWKKTVSALVVPDTIDESDETAIITLTNPNGATLGRSVGTVTIIDDDDGSPSDPNATTIAAVGDLGGSAEVVGPVADQIEALDPDFAMALGDLVYPDGQASGFNGFFDATWGRFRSKIIATPGNHDYHTAGASGFYGYFPQAEYFARDIGTNGWRVYVLNCEISCASGSAQAGFVAQDIVSFPNRHRFAIVHRPRFTSGSSHGDFGDLTTIWNSLAAGGGEFMLAGHNHVYERFARMTGAGVVSGSGMRSFVVGTGGRGLYGFGSLHAGEEFRDNTHHGVLVMELGATSYTWRFVGTNGDIVDTGTQATK